MGHYLTRTLFSLCLFQAVVKFKKYPFFRQKDEMDCGYTCLRMVAKFYGRTYSSIELEETAYASRSGIGLGELSAAAERIGMGTLPIQCTFDTLRVEVPLPCVAYWHQKHYIVVYEVNDKGVLVADPAFGLVRYSQPEFITGWLAGKASAASAEGILLLLEATPDFYTAPDQPAAAPVGLRYLTPFFKPYQKYVVQLLLGLAVSSILQLAFPFLTQLLVDKGVSNRNLSFLYLILLAQLMLFVSQTVIGGIRRWLLLSITSRMNMSMLSHFLIKLMRLPVAFFDSKNVGDIMQRIQDHYRIQDFLSVTTLDILFQSVSLLIFSLVLFVFNVKIFVCFFVGTALYTAWAILFLRQRALLDFKKFESASSSQSSSIQIVNGMQEIVLNGSERRRRWEWESLQAANFRLAIKGLTLSQIQDMGGTFLNESKNIIITFLAASAVIKGEITLGVMLSVQYIIGQMNLPVNNIIIFIRTLQDAGLSLNRLSEIHNKRDEEPAHEVTHRSLPDDKSISIHKLSFHYGTSTSEWVLQNLQFTIPAGKVTAIVGASGSGKTTLLKLLLKFYEPQQGQIDIDHLNLRDISHSFWRSQCGAVMQEGFIFSDSIARNISESDANASIDKQRLVEAARIANIHEFISALPQGYHTRIGADGLNLSGGQRQRILIARAVYKNPQYLFFDEATSALDANNESLIVSNLAAFFKGRTVVIIAHRLSTVKNADQIIVLEKGRIVEHGSHADLTSFKGIYFKLVKNQLELGN